MAKADRSGNNWAKGLGAAGSVASAIGGATQPGSNYQTAKMLTPEIVQAIKEAMQGVWPNPKAQTPIPVDPKAKVMENLPPWAIVDEWGRGGGRVQPRPGEFSSSPYQGIFQPDRKLF